MKKILLFSLFLLVIAAMTACKPAPEPVDTQPTNTTHNFLNPGYQEVVISGYMFTPKAITVYQGDRVKWINKMPFVKSIWLWGMAPSPVIQSSKSWSYIFTEPGFYKYRDQYAQDMEGNVTVLPYDERPDIKAKTQTSPVGP
jgi:plastocyanin